jgi:hypothetical protein
MSRVLLAAAGAAALSLTVLAGQARADEPLFGFVYTTDLLPKGQKEVEQWVTWRNQKAGGYFDQLDGRTEVSYGLSDRMQLSAYANWTWARAWRNGPFGETTPPEPLSYDAPGPDDHYQGARFVGVSGEAIYRVLSPYTSPVGLAIYEEPTVGPDFVESETKLIVQKNFKDDRLVVALNLTYAPEWRRVTDEDNPSRKVWSEETDANIGLAVSYRFAPNWSAGLEFENEYEFASYDFSRMANGGYYLGPTIHYAAKRFFVTASYLEQMPWASVHSDTVPGAIVGGRIYDNDFERRRLRVKVGYLF